jgi:hypothetical protein
VTDTNTTTTPPVSLLEQALDAGDSRTGIKAAIARARSAPRDKPEHELPSQLLDRLVDELIAGGDLPEDLGEQAVAATREAERLQALHEMRVAVVDRLRMELEATEATGGDAALEFLRDRLNELLDEARTIVETLGDVSTPAQAYAAGGAVLEAWARFTQLVDRHQLIRGAQFEVLRRAGEFGGAPDALRTLVAGSGSHSNICDLEPETTFRNLNVEVMRTHEGRRALPAPSWPDDPTELLRWMVTSSDAQPWLPSRREMHDLERQRIELRRAAEHARATGRRGELDRMTQAQFDQHLTMHRALAGDGDR